MRQGKRCLCVEEEGGGGGGVRRCEFEPIIERKTYSHGYR